MNFAYIFLQKLQFKRDPTVDEVFYYAHTRRLKKKKNLIIDAEENDMDDEDDEDVEVIWIDKKNQQIYVSFIFSWFMFYFM